MSESFREAQSEQPVAAHEELKAQAVDTVAELLAGCESPEAAIVALQDLLQECNQLDPETHQPDNSLRFVAIEAANELAELLPNPAAVYMHAVTPSNPEAANQNRVPVAEVA